MFVEARTVPAGTSIETDVCIVGAGAAGITIARELESATRRVILLESGFFEPNPETQSLYEGESRGVPYFPLGDEGTRVRRFGGTTSRWNGECRPLDPLDFEPRAWVPGSGWPFDREHLRPHYDRAGAICELGPIAHATADEPLLRDDPLRSTGLITPAVLQYSPPTRFGDAFRGELSRSPTATVYLGANVVDLVTLESGRAVSRADVATIDGHRFAVRARAFVLATGGIENARLLLAADTVHRAGLGNARDLVGRHFMEHLYLDGAATIATDRRSRRAYANDLWIAGRRVRIVLSLSESAQRSERLTNSTAVVGALPARNGRLDRFRHAAQRGMQSVRRTERVRVKHIQEQVPNRDSRVTLSHERDRLGSRRARLDWQLSALDKQTAARSYGILDEALRAAGAGRVIASQFDDGPDWPSGLRGGRHHMGTTRMHPDPAQGVVDADCRVHGVANLFVTGSSVFPTSGSANPTLTIVALAVRLADHLKTTAPTPANPE